MREQGRPPLEHPHGFHGGQGLLEYCQALGHPARQHIQVAELVRYLPEQLRKVSFTGQREPTLSQPDGVVEVPLRPVDTAQAPQYARQAIGVIEHPGESDPFLALPHPTIELAAFGQRQRPEETRHHDRKTGQATALAEPIARQQLQDP
jgi:hypothetical protein